MRKDNHPILVILLGKTFTSIVMLLLGLCIVIPEALQGHLTIELFSDQWPTLLLFTVPFIALSTNLLYKKEDFFAEIGAVELTLCLSWVLTFLTQFYAMPSRTAEVYRFLILASIGVIASGLILLIALLTVLNKIYVLTKYVYRILR